MTETQFLLIDIVAQNNICRAKTTVDIDSNTLYMANIYAKSYSNENGHYYIQGNWTFNVQCCHSKIEMYQIDIFLLQYHIQYIKYCNGVHLKEAVRHLSSRDKKKTWG